MPLMNREPVDYDRRRDSFARRPEGASRFGTIRETEPCTAFITFPAGQASRARRIGFETRQLAVEVRIRVSKRPTTQFYLVAKACRTDPRRVHADESSRDRVQDERADALPRLHLRGLEANAGARRPMGKNVDGGSAGLLRYAVAGCLT